MDRTAPVLLFDGECNLCDTLVRFIIKHDRSKRIMFSPLQSDTSKILLRRFGLPEKDLNTVVYLKGETYYLRSSAILNILRDLRGGWSLFYGFIIIPGFILDIFYKIIARNRFSIFGRKAMCSDVPSCKE